MNAPTHITEQDRLLTININAEKIVTGVIPGVLVHPLFLDRENGVWVLFAKFEPGTILPMHFHTGTVHFFTTAGAWNYVEHPEDVQIAGSYLYEPGGSIHTLSVKADATEAAAGFMLVNGANINFDGENNFLNIMDAGWIEDSILAACKDQGRQPPRYVKPKSGAGFSDA